MQQQQQQEQQQQVSSLRALAELRKTTWGSITPPRLDSCTKEQIFQYLDNTWGLEEMLLSSLTEEVIPTTANPLRRPLLFYLAHTAVSYVNKLLLAKVIPERINPDFESLFAVGVDEMSWDDKDLNENCQWPPVSDVQKYRADVYSKVREVIENADLKLPITWDHPLWALFMGMEHHRIHIETSSVLIRELPVDKVQRPAVWKDAPTKGNPPPNELINVPEGVVRFGKPRNFPYYGWDNEYGSKEVKVPSFKASKYLITNKEFLEFVEDGGYNKEEYWTTEGWKWAQSKAPVAGCPGHPHFWVRSDGGSFKYRAMFDVRDMPWDWPVDVNFHEAKAYCKWKGPEYRVLTEAEWHRIRDTDEGPEKDHLWSNIEERANIQMRFGSSTPVDFFPPNRLGFHDVHGNVWQWAEDYFNGLPGFETHDLYDDFSTPCFDSEHNMILGGSWISTGSEASVFSRFAFRRHFFQHLGFRVVVSSNPIPANSENIGTSMVYETDTLVSQYMFFHYGKDEDLLPYDFGPKEALQFPARVAQECLRISRGTNPQRALDLGCSVGRSTFEMAREIPYVLGIDFSARFVSCGCRLKEQGQLEYTVQEEGDRTITRTATVPDDIDRGRTDFKQGDACNLPHFIGTFDVLLMSNLIDRLSVPMSCLQRLPSLMNPGGFVVIISPYTWMEDFTPRGNWLCNENETTFEALQRVMTANGFEFLEKKDIPFFIREHRRKFQYGVSQASFWQLKKASH